MGQSKPRSTRRSTAKATTKPPKAAAPAPRVLMLGWEFPPRMAGGLGKACQGLSQAIADQGAQVCFVLPTFPQRIAEKELFVFGAREVLEHAGWTPERLENLPSIYWSHENAPDLASAPKTQDEGNMNQIVHVRAAAELFPYGLAPTGKLPRGIQRLLGESGDQRQKRGGPDQAYGTISIDATGAMRRMLDPKQDGVRANGARKDEIYGRNLWREIERYSFAMRHLAGAYDAEVVHAHDWMSFPAALEYQRAKPNVPVFVHVHATEYDRSGENVNTDVYRIEREGFRRATHIFAVSNYTAGVIERLYGVPRSKITVAYNAPDESAKRLIAPPSTHRAAQVVFLGRLTFQKGPEHFLHAARIVRDLAPPRLGPVRFLFCGTGDMLDQLVELTHRLDLDENVRFTGFIDPQDVDKILLDSRVLVMPSVSEPFGLVALEAIHCGIPVIISKQSGVREVLQRALQVDFWDHEKLADQILAALRLNALSQQLVDEGMEQLRELSWQRSAQTVVNTYRRFL